MTIQPLAARQIDVGIAGFFRVEAESPAANQVTLKAGSFTRGGFSIVQNSSFPADQTSAGFAVVSAGFQRYDLVSIDATGAVVITQGYEVSLGSGEFQGAPGWTGTNPGIRIPDGLLPMAYVLIDETASVTVEGGDITSLSSLHQVRRDYDGYLVDKGLFGSAPAGASDAVTTLFAADTRVAAAGGTEPDSGGSATQSGVVTSAPLNYVHLLDENGDEIIHAATGARCYGRLTEAAGVWTLAYYYINAAGAETSMDPSTDATRVPTDVRLVGVPRVYSRNDPNRPLFDSNVARLSDQIAGDIPLATETAPGKVQLAADLDTAANEAVQGNDQRLGTVQVEDEGGGAIARFNMLNFIGAGVTAANGGGGVADITIPGAGFNASIFDQGTFAWSNATTAISTGALGFTPVLAIAIATFEHDNTGSAAGSGRTTFAVGFATGTAGNAKSAGVYQTGSGTGNDDGCTTDPDSIAGVSSEPGANRKTDWDVADIDVTAWSSAGITLTPSAAVTGSIHLLVLG